jgi:hypothetical protein
MKAIHFILIVGFLSGFSNLSAQPYYRILKDGRNWIYTRMAEHDPPIYISHAYALSIQGDTLLQGNSYKKIYQRTLKINSSSTSIQDPKEILTTDLYALMREDTIDRKVYLLPILDTFSSCQSTEHLLYDFSLEEGDTLNDCLLENLYEPWLSFVPRVDSIRPYVFSGLATRAFYTKGIFYNGEDLFEIESRILEGFGYEIHGLINYGRKGSLVIFQYFCEGDSLDCELLSDVNELPRLPQAVVTVSPNPASDILTIQVEPAFRSQSELQFSLVNTEGHVVTQVNWNALTKLDIDVSSLEDGMYFLNVCGKRIKAIKKIVIAH